ncbi:MAG: glycerol acyltransferase [Chloroflexi bacterium]|nr:glycerol acyltransferase [Chloroflexota bacterium]
MKRIDKVNVPHLGDEIPRRGNRFSKGIASFLMRITGWRFEGTLPNLPKFVVIGAPHTSNWDFPNTMFAMFALGMRFSWMAKHTFVNGPLKPLNLWLGGVAINRSAAHGVVAQTVEQFKKRAQFLLIISPEGTRSKVYRWKMGFYHIAHGANVPIVPFAMDYGRKVVKIGNPINAVADIKAVLAQVEEFYKDVTAQNPDLFSLAPLREMQEKIGTTA